MKKLLLAFFLSCLAALPLLCGCTTPVLPDAPTVCEHRYGTDWECLDCDHSMLPSEGLVFALNANGASYTVTGIGTCTDEELVIPATHAGIPVTIVSANAFAANDTIKALYLPCTLTTIENEAFLGCASLTTVWIPDNVLQINTSAFARCSSLTELRLPNNVGTRVGYFAFADCTALKTVTVNYGSKFVTDDGVMEMQGGDNTSTFDGCTSLESVVIGSNVTRIGKGMFADCTSLKSVTLSESVTDIWHGAFAHCTALEDLTIPESVTLIENGAFYQCDALLQEENGIFYADNWVVDCDRAITTATLRAGTVGIANDVFMQHKNLTSITLPDSLKHLGKQAFSCCRKLESITIPDGVNRIDDRTFEACSNLRSVILGDGVTELDPSAFADCQLLETIVIPKGMTSIGMGAFNNCRQLRFVYYCGDKALWSTIKINSQNDKLTVFSGGAQICYYTEEPTTAANAWHYVDGVPTHWN